MKDSKTELMRDLCARLPYHVIVNYRGSKVDLTKYARSVKLECCKPYLRPMSSMTEEEAREYANCGNIIANSPQNNYLIPNPNCVDWLNSKHFDFRGLIPKGLAIEAPENMYNIKKK